MDIHQMMWKNQGFMKKMCNVSLTKLEDVDNSNYRVPVDLISKPNYIQSF